MGSNLFSGERIFFVTNGVGKMGNHRGKNEL